ncbi:MAG: peptide chain release factor N(5)-glutamine methyltransferase [Clostridiales bacterium]|nr:peptide chain release factor N(5)-glutamine methyltransferase [Clostridiales bacterium]
MSFLLVSDIIKMAQKQLEEAGVEDVKGDAEALYCYLKHVDRARFFLSWSNPADDLTCENYFDLVARRCKREPLQLITGEQEFMGIPIKTKKGVLIPRLDTEVVAMAAELLLKEQKNKTVLDLCCGSGALGIALAKRADAKVTFADISEAAVSLTKENIVMNAVKGADVVWGDLFDPVAKKRFGMIVSNPPYIETAVIPTLMPEVRQWEPLSALNGGADGLDFYRRIIDGAPAHLKKGGTLVLEIGSDQAYGVTELLEKSPAFTEIKVIKDLAHNDRVVTAQFDWKAARLVSRVTRKLGKIPAAEGLPEEEGDEA